MKQVRQKKNHFYSAHCSPEVSWFGRQGQKRLHSQLESWEGASGFSVSVFQRLETWLERPATLKGSRYEMAKECDWEVIREVKGQGSCRLCCVGGSNVWTEQRLLKLGETCARQINRQKQHLCLPFAPLLCLICTAYFFFPRGAGAPREKMSGMFTTITIC